MKPFLKYLEILYVIVICAPIAYITYMFIVSMETRKILITESKN